MATGSFITPTGISVLNTLTEQVQTFATGTTGTDFAINSSTGVHTFNLPTASATNRGALSSQDWIDFNTHNIVITTATSITTSTNNTSGYGQNGRNVMIANGANAINLTCETTSDANFVASYTKLGSAAITFLAGVGATLVQVDATNVFNGIVGSTACLTRNGNTFYLQISNR